jgi:hypothetical protein
MLNSVEACGQALARPSTVLGVTGHYFFVIAMNGAPDSYRDASDAMHRLLYHFGARSPYQ